MSERVVRGFSDEACWLLRIGHPHVRLCPVRFYWLLAHPASAYYFDGEDS